MEKTMKPQRKCLVESILAGTPGREAARRLLAEMAIGIASGIEQGRLSVEEAADDLFSLDNYLALRRNRLGKDLLELFQWGMQLEDVVEVVPGPDALKESLGSIVAIAHKVLAVQPARLARRRPSRPRLRTPARSRVA
jgi:hypothetical protein